MSDLASRIARLSPEKQALFTQRLRRESTAAGTAQRIPRRGGAGSAPLSFAQERLWFLDRLAPGSTASNLTDVLRLLGDLDRRALVRALGEVVRRHESLRTAFGEVDGRPVQRVAAPVFTAPEIDLGGLPGDRREDEALRLARVERDTPFDLATGLLLRFLLFTLEQRQHIAVLTVHHIASDAWSFEVFVREFSLLYRAFQNGAQPALPELEIQYADFAVWQRQRLVGPRLAELLQFWTRQLAAAPELLELPTDRPRPLHQGLRGGEVSARLPPGLADRLRSLARERQATLFVLILTVVQVLLHRWSGREDFLVGTPVANRDRLELEPLIGFLVNTLVLRADLAGDPTFSAALEGARSRTLDATSHQELPFERLVEELRPQRSLGHHPLIQVMLALANLPAGPVDLPGLTISPIVLPATQARFDLTLFVNDTGRELVAVAEYDRGLFDPSTVKRLLGQLERLLAAAATNSERRLSDLPLVGPAERHQLLAEWNDTAACRPASDPVHRLVARQATRQPDAAALSAAGVVVTYGELLDRARRLACRLRRIGVGPEEVVALLFPRTPDVVVAMLAVLEAGAAYLPLDPSYPSERLARMVVDARCRCLLTAGDGLEVPGVPRIGFRDEGRATFLEEPPPAERDVLPADLAYVIFTSGSTGRPKGVAVPHGSLLNLIGWHLSDYPVASGERVGQVAGLAFDASVWEIWPPLTAGGCLCFAGEELRTDPAALAAWLAAAGISCAFAPTPLAEGLLQSPWPPDGSLRALLTGGDALRRRPSPALPWRLVNHYGPTENAVVATRAAVAPAGAEEASPPIGLPIANVHAVVVDIAGQPAPPGIAGELLLGGASLARGYLGRPELTAERFVPDPWSGAGERLYRTGDLVRRLPGGVLVYLGRIDRQVKVRGIRIELGEIEAALAGLPEVRDAVVDALPGPHGRRLVAYVVPEGDGTLAPESLRKALARHLPDAMIPAAWMVLPALPLTPNGKVDRAALAGMADTAGDPAVVQILRTPFEEVLAEIWAELLDRERIGAFESFFEAGGHSLLATQLVSRVRRSFDVDLPIRAVFEEPTLAGLAGCIERLLQRDGGEPAPPLCPRPRGTHPSLSFAQERLWLIAQLRPGSAVYNIPLALRLSGALRREFLAASLQEVVARHEVLRTTFAETEEGRAYQVIGPALPVALPLVDLAALEAGGREAEARRLAREEAARPFDLVRGPVWRVALLSHAAEDHLVLFTVHHIAADGWSMDLLVREIGAAYGALARGERPGLAPLALQYADFAAWQREWLTGAVLARQAAWWRHSLAGLPPALDLPFDRPRPAVQSFRGGLVPMALPAELVRALRPLCRGARATAFMTLLALFQVLLARWSGQESVVVGSPIAGRNRLEIEGLIGFFVNTLPLAARFPGDLTFRALLEQVRETTLGAYAHQDLPFERLVEEVQPERSLAHSPVFQAFFVLQNAARGPLELPGLRLAPMGVDGRGAKFDLTLDLAEGPDGLAGAFEYAADLWDGATVRRLAGHLAHLAAAAVAAPDEPLWELSLLPAHERTQILVEWNDGAAAAPQRGLAELLHERAAANPDAPAVSAGDTVLSFGELSARSARLAARLRQLGVGPGVLTGICFERSVDLIVALLAVVEAGGAYVPLDPSYPPERLELLAQDAGLGALLSTSSLLPRLPARGTATLCLDLPETAAAPPASPGGPAGAGDLLYVIYTSGSTGRPRGAGVYRGAFLSLVRWYLDAFEIGAADRFLLVSSFSFDLTQKNLFAPLLAGGRLHLAPPGSYDPDLLAAEIARQRITRLNCTPSAFYPLAEREEGADLASLRTVFLGGEPIQEARLARWRAACRDVEVVNTYGPTECTDVVAFHRLASEPGGGPVPVGRPVRNARLYVLDRRHRPAPLGVVGQIAVGGDCVGAGYLRDAALTARRFVPDPSAEAPGARLYLTGDLGRFLQTGALEYLGRSDFQVKIRGFRIELEEVEAALADHPDVAAVAVAARQGPAGQRLVAFVVAAGEPERLPAGLREHLARRLPDYMVPSLFVPLAALPLSPNGKVDRKALPEPAPTDAGVAPGGTRWLTPAEELVAGIWARVLGREEVAPGASFFDLGGHSLLASQAVAQLRRAFGAEVALRDLFEARDAGDLASRLGAGPAPSVPPLVPAERPAQIPLSFAQERLWFLQQLDPESSAYHIPLAIDLHGSLDEGVLGRALAEVVRRHEALRTTFVPGEGGEPRQRISAPEGWQFPLIDLLALPDAARMAAELRRLVAAEAVRTFDLEAGPPARACLLRRGPGAWTLLLTLHHIVSDGWSMEVLVRELGALHAAFGAGLPSPLPDLPVQYADYALWQRGWLAGDILARELDHWRQALTGAPFVLALPTDRPRPAVQRFRAGAWSQRLPDPAARTLRSLGRSLSATPFMLALALLQLLLSRWTGQDDLLVGSPVANRDRMETEGLIGFFVNTLVLRGDLSGDPSFAELVGHARRTVLEAVSHQDLPFEKLVEDLQPERDLATSPLFQLLLVWQGAPADLPALPHLRLMPGGEAAGTGAKFDLTLSWNELSSGGVAVSFEYDSDLFDLTTVARLAARLATVLSAVGIAPESRVAELSLLAPAERQQIVAEWGDGGAIERPTGALHTLFEIQAERSPGALALVAGEERLTYSELDRRADRLAGRLRRAGVGPEEKVGVLAERSAALVVGMLGVLKAGGAYVPIDPAHPRERQAFLLADAGVRVLLISGEHAETAAEISVSGTGVIVDLDEAAAPVGEQEARRERPGLTPGNLAYLIYTSGSTGLPKGVAIEHRSAVALVAWAGQVYVPEELAAVLFATSISFDLSVFELFVPLSSGGCVVLAANALELPALPAAAEVRLVNTVPSAMAELVRAGTFPPGVRTVNLAGEPLTRHLADQIHALGTVERLFNLYGPSEDTTYSTFARIQAGEEPSIGRPLPGTRSYVLDRHLQPVPGGAPGELYLAGDGLARCYLNRPDLTAERFLPDPFQGPGGRLYRTGDLARWRPDGSLDFLGRSDHQVKVRGFRIELGEVEAALLCCSGVRQAVVLAFGAGADRRLVAFVAAEGAGTVPNQRADQISDGLRATLSDRLPSYMVPSGFLVLDGLPLTPNGKIDRQALARMAAGVRSETAPSSTSRPARSTWEDLAAGIWAQVLGAPADGLAGTAHFFNLGGHSLLATRVVSRVAAVLGVEVPLRLLFERPTLERFADALEEAVRGGGRPALPPLTPVPRQGPLPLSFAQERLWFLDQLEPGSAAYDIPGAFVLDGGLDVRALADSLTEIVRRHEVLRTVFRAADGLPVQEALPAGPFVLPVCDLSDLAPALQESGVQSLLAEEASRPFDLAAGPVLRVVLLRLAAARHVVLFNMHHIASDAWSLEVLARELAALYPALVAGKASPLPALPVQYADFAVWQRSWLTGEELERQLAHWREHLAGAAPQLDLPTDRPRERSAGGSAGTVPVEVPDELARALAAAGRREGTTLFMVLLAAFQAVLSRVASQADITVGAPIAGRTRLETEALIGFFVNTLALRTLVDGAEELGSLLRRVRRTVVAAFLHQDLPFERLVEALQPERSLHSTPLFQVLFNFQIGSEAAIDLPGLRLVPAPLAPVRTKFDLTLAGTADRERLELALTYNRDLFDRATVARLGCRLEIFLAALAETPGRRIADVELLAPAERHQLLVDWGRGPSTPASALCLHQLFEAQADRTPLAPALVFEDEAFSYAELDLRANRLAHRLLRLGVAPEDRVGIFLERSGDAVVTLLAVLKAGGAYVPLDPAWPAPRLAGLLGEAGVQVVVTRERLLSLLPALPALLPLPLESAGTGNGSGGRPGLPLDPRQIAYLLFTSGSTGRPKGVAVEHRQIVHYVGAVLERLELAEPSSFALVSTLSADLGNTSLFPALATGGALHVLSAERATDPEGMADYFERHRIDCLKIVPSHLRALRTGSRPHAVLPRRRLILGGEALSWQEADELAAVVPDCTILNHYGPTESTVGVTTCRLAEAARRGATVPLGRPLRNVEAYLLDPHGQPTPPGTPGDLHLGGAGLARGYWGRPDLTAERFLPDPFGEEPGARLYRTGDRVQFTPEGQLQFLGRLDHQVKVRGFRIELGEIEAALADLPAVREAAVVVRGEGEARRLAAYVVLASGEDLAIPQLRDALRERLPEPMVPGEWQILPRLPLNANGKVDRRALPAPEQMAGSGSTPPRDEIEIGLAQVWEELLGGGPVGAHDSFFELGGQSLLAVRLLARVERRFGRRLALADLIQGPTVAQMARRLRSGELARTRSILVPIQPNGAAPPLFWVHPVGGSVFCYLELARRLGGDQPSYALQAPGSDHPAVRLEVLAACYLEEIRRVQPAGPYRLAGWSMGGVVAFEMARQLEAAGEGVSLLALLDVGAPGPRTDEPDDRATELLLFTRDLGRLLADPAAVDPVRFEQLVNAEPSLDRLWAMPELRAALPADLDLEQVQELFAVFRRNRRTVREYRPGRYGGALTLIRAAESEVDAGALVAGWGGLAAGGVEIAVVPGDHYSILWAPGIEKLALLLAERLEWPGRMALPGVTA